MSTESSKKLIIYKKILNVSEGTTPQTN